MDPLETIDKLALLAMLRAAVEADLAAMVAAAHVARDAATHEENKPENDKDTRAVEAGYLAEAQSVRAAELQRALRDLRDLQVRDFDEDEDIAASAVVDIEDEGGAVARCFIVPAGGGARIPYGGGVVQAVTPRSPLGQALLGKRAGDDFEVLGGRTRRGAIVGVR